MSEVEDMVYILLQRLVKKAQVVGAEEADGRHQLLEYKVGRVAQVLPL